MLTEWWWFFCAILANCSAVVPNFSMCSMPALPNIWGAPGAFAKPRNSTMSLKCLSIGLVRSVYFTPSEPFSIFSKPSAIVQSANPPSTSCLAMKSAVDPVEQLLLTL